MNENKENRIYRMYFLVLYSLSAMQKGIQSGHAAIEFANEFGNTDFYKTWATRDKTFIVLDGGTTNDNENQLGTLNQHFLSLEEKDISFSSFREPDLGNQITALAFIVDDRVWDKENYPDFIYAINETPLYNEVEEHKWITNFSEDKNEAETIVWMRSFLKNFSLAR